MVLNSLRHIEKPKQLIDRVAMWIATGGYSGCIGPAPGTNGSFVGLLLFLPLARVPVLVQLTATGILFGLGVWASGRTEELMKTKDAGPIVVDEIVGMWTSILFLPYRINYLIAAFILFRLFDIWKPFPAKQVEELKGGLGIMTDDLIAGFYTNAILQGIHFSALLT